MAARAAALNSYWNSGFFTSRVVALWGGWEDLRQQVLQETIKYSLCIPINDAIHKFNFNV